ncbi:Uncharacterised protein [Mycobacteroides abscessus subsp. abscessus]|nr:Uncharacterised protein [Mycobacteroides abscessus subsp. abscessus]
MPSSPPSASNSSHSAPPSTYWSSGALSTTVPLSAVVRVSMMRRWPAMSEATNRTRARLPTSRVIVAVTSVTVVQRCQ